MDMQSSSWNDELIFVLSMAACKTPFWHVRDLVGSAPVVVFLREIVPVGVLFWHRQGIRRSALPVEGVGVPLLGGDIGNDAIYKMGH